MSSGRYNSSAPTPAAGDIVDLQTDAQGRLITTDKITGGGLAPLGYQQITSLSAAAGLTIPTGAVIAILNAEDQDVRWRDDGTDPTATVGMVLPRGSYYTYGGTLSALKLIEETASAKLNISYY